MEYEFSALYLASGLGAGALGFTRARAQLGADGARFRNLGGVDFDPDACADFERITGGPSLCADLHDLTPSELRLFAGDRRPDAVFTSSPCKGLSRLLGREAAALEKYQHLNSLVFKSIFLACETWPEDPPPMFILENVPGIATRGAAFLEQVRGLLRSYGYLLNEGTHDCGEIGNLAQHRRRYLLVARREKAVRSFVHKPPIHRVRGCGEVLGDLPMPMDPSGGRLHRMPKISWLNWVRLALIPPGGDWRDLPTAEGLRHKVNVASFKGSPGLCGVERWDDPTHAITGSMGVSSSNTPSAVADPRIETYRGRYGVLDWAESAPCIIGNARATTGKFSVADPRLTTPLKPGQARREVFRRYPVYDWNEAADTVTGPAGHADPNVGDPRLKCAPRAGAYGVLSWHAAAGTIIGATRVDNGRYAVADPRKAPVEAPIIIAEDGTWHRPMTDLDLASLQGLPSTIHGVALELTRGGGISTVRERIGNAVPVGAAEAIAKSLLKALLASVTGTWFLSSDEIWVRKRDGAPETQWEVHA